MKKPSRKMPKIQDYKERSDVTLKILDTCFVGGLIYLSIEIPLMLPLLAILVLLGKVSYRKQKAKLARIAVERQDASICTFARSFDYRSVDTWAIRAVYEYIQKHIESEFSRSNFPISKKDSLNLFSLAEDIEEDWVEIATRISRSTDLDDMALNPFSGIVYTVEDLVFFLTNQPQLNER